MEKLLLRRLCHVLNHTIVIPRWSRYFGPIFHRCHNRNKLLIFTYPSVSSTFFAFSALWSIREATLGHCMGRQHRLSRGETGWATRSIRVRDQLLVQGQRRGLFLLRSDSRLQVCDVLLVFLYLFGSHQETSAFETTAETRHILADRQVILVPLVVYSKLFSRHDFP